MDQSFEPVNKVEEVDLSGASLSATTRNVTAGSARKLVGAAGAYRAKGDMADGSAFYFFGGISDPASGDATGDVQSYTTKTSTWAVETGLNLTDRVFAAAAYDPGHDVIWIVGGTSSCSLPEVLMGQSCNVQSRPVQYLSFDPGTGAPKMNTLGGASFNFYAHSMVYDSTVKRMLIYGGTNDIKKGNSNLVALDLSDPDVTKAKLGPVSTSGQSPSVYFHGASYDAIHNWMVVYGGVKQNFLQAQRERGHRHLGAGPGCHAQSHVAEPEPAGHARATGWPPAPSTTPSTWPPSRPWAGRSTSLRVHRPPAPSAPSTALPAPRTLRRP